MDEQDRKAEIQRKRIETLRANKAKKKAEEERLQREQEDKQKMIKSVLSVDIFQKRVELMGLFNDTFEIASAIIKGAKQNPTEVSASMLNVCMRMLKECSDSLKELEELQAVKEKHDQMDDDGLTPEERRMIEKFEQLTEDSTNNPYHQDYRPKESQKEQEDNEELL